MRARDLAEGAPRAVIFDIGGVVVGSPLHAIAAYERELALPPGSVNRLVVSQGPEGAWARLERGELTQEAFFEAFDREGEAAGISFSSREMMARIGAVTVPRPHMLAAIRRIRDRGLRTAALTNNWAAAEGEADVSRANELRALFDVFVESTVEGLRKPDPRIYRLVCERLEVEPVEAVFLDDIGRNLKAARELGMTTIKVAEPDDALAELEEVLGFPLRESIEG